MMTRAEAMAERQKERERQRQTQKNRHTRLHPRADERNAVDLQAHIPYPRRPWARADFPAACQPDRTQWHPCPAWRNSHRTHSARHHPRPGKTCTGTTPNARFWRHRCPAFGPG
ncbi:hypothetical protein HC928_25980 [bacterium]|nr:hypothetical protein [bacterium]